MLKSLLKRTERVSMSDRLLGRDGNRKLKSDESAGAGARRSNVGQQIYKEDTG